MTHEPTVMPAPESTLFREIELATAHELLDDLSAHRGRLWEGRRSEDERWIFRGQRDATWGLVPSALRDGVLLRFARNAIDDPSVREELSMGFQLELEQGVVNKFVIGVDRKGLAVPGDRQTLRDYYREEDPTFQGFPPIDQRPIFALAQHYGVPTRLLDWSHSPRTAAYFACVDVAKALANAEPASERFAVWALSQDFVERTARKWEPKITIVTAPTVSNPNLYAQQGLFTLVEYREKAVDWIAGMPLIPTIDHLLRDPPSTRLWSRREPPLWKFSVPACEAGVLLRLLAHENVTAAQVYSGHDAIVKSIREEAWHR